MKHIQYRLNGNILLKQFCFLHHVIFFICKVSRLGTAEPLGLCIAPTEPLGNNSSYSHNLLQRYEVFLNYTHFVDSFFK